MKNQHPRILDPYCMYQREEVMSGRWVLSQDEFRRLFDAIDDVCDDYDEEIAKLKADIKDLDMVIDGLVDKIDELTEDLEGKNAN